MRVLYSFVKHFLMLYTDLSKHGKKRFKLSLFPDVCLLRVLCVGGTLVVLLTPQLSCHLKKLLSQQHFGVQCNEEPQTGRKHCLVSSSEQQNPQVKPSSSQETLSFSSLRHQTTYRVSLGAIDGLIHKYIKTFD